MLWRCGAVVTVTYKAVVVVKSVLAVADCVFELVVSVVLAMQWWCKAVRAVVDVDGSCVGDGGGGRSRTVCGVAALRCHRYL